MICNNLDMVKTIETAADTFRQRPIPFRRNFEVIVLGMAVVLNSIAQTR